MKEREFEKAYQFLSCYFHQDWGLEYGDANEAIGSFINGSSQNPRAEVARELRQILAQVPEEELDRAIFSLGCYYDPATLEGISMKAWLEKVIAQISRSLDSKC
nr:contact-dependent growth inhibition system immunity protein [uncultured Methanoregula sp.]